MSSLTLQCLTVLFGWIRLPVEGVRNLISGRSGKGLLSRVWPLLLLLLLIVGTVIDIVVRHREKSDRQRMERNALLIEQQEEERRVWEASASAGEEPPSPVPAFPEPAPLQNPEVPAVSVYRNPQVPFRADVYTSPAFSEPPFFFDTPPDPSAPRNKALQPSAEQSQPAPTSYFPEQSFVFDEPAPVRNASVYAAPPKAPVQETVLQKISKKTRDFMGESTSSIYDFRSSINMNEALRAPVYPDQNRQGDS